MSAPNIGLTPLQGYGLTPAQIKAPAAADLLPDAYRWIFFDITAPHNKYVLNQTTGYFVPLALGAQPISFQTSANYNMAMADAGTVVDMNFATANTFTVLNDATLPLPIGSVVDVVMGGVGVTSIAAGAGVTLVKAGTDSLAISAQHRGARLRKVAANTWRVSAN